MKNKRTKEEYESAAKQSRSIAQLCKLLGIKPVGGNYKCVKHAIEEYQIDISHFDGKGWNKGLKFNPNPAKPLNELLVENSYYQTFKLKQRLLNEGLKEYKCECCGNVEWQGKPIPLELHHKNGVNTDNRLENLLFLCPNCHAQTDNYRGLNKSAQGGNS